MIAKMANSEHLELLRQGASTWNAWRKSDPSVRPDLSKADLRHVNLCGADLRDAILCNANLSAAKLKRADLRWPADLHDSALIEANLRGANLRGADLSGARLIEADLNGADLSEFFEEKPHPVILRGSFQNSRASRPATRNMQAVWSKDWMTNPSRS